MSHYDSEMMVAVTVAKTAMPMMRLLNRAKSRRSEALDSTANSCSRTSNGGSGGDGSTDEDANAHVCRSLRGRYIYFKLESWRSSRSASDSSNGRRGCCSRRLHSLKC